MDDRPRQWEERHALTLEVQLDEFTIAVRAALLAAAQEHSRLELYDLRSSLIHDSEHERFYVAIRRNDRVPAEKNLGRRPCETGEDDAGDQRKGQNSKQRLEGHEEICSERHRNDVAVSNRGNRLRPLRTADGRAS